MYQPAYTKPFNKINVNNRIFTISTGATGAGFLPSTVSHTSQKKSPEAMVFDSTFFFAVELLDPETNDLQQSTVGIYDYLCVYLYIIYICIFLRRYSKYFCILYIHMPFISFIGEFFDFPGERWCFRTACSKIG